jgi:predicted metal-dependent hydrolase
VEEKSYAFVVVTKEGSEREQDTEEKEEKNKKVFSTRDHMKCVVVVEKSEREKQTGRRNSTPTWCKQRGEIFSSSL